MWILSCVGLTGALGHTNRAVLVLGIGVGLHSICKLVVDHSLWALRHAGARVVEVPAGLQNAIYNTGTLFSLHLRFLYCNMWKYLIIKACGRLGLTKQSVSLGPVQPPAHSTWQHSLGFLPKQRPLHWGAHTVFVTVRESTLVKTWRETKTVP